MEDVFNKLQGNRNNTMENLIRWMKEAKIIDIAQAEAERRVRKLFKEHVPDPRNVALEGFKTIVKKLAADQKLPMEHFTSKLLNMGPALLKMSEEHQLEVGGPLDAAPDDAGHSTEVAAYPAEGTPHEEGEHPDGEGEHPDDEADSQAASAVSSGTALSQFSHVSDHTYTSYVTLSSDGGPDFVSTG